jgi:L-iditol 2-dehydrogenase
MTQTATTKSTTIPDRMRASVLTGIKTLSIEHVPTPPMESDEVLVEVAAVGVCGSDTHYYRHGRIGDFVVTGPLILGHELSGRIVAVGEEVPESRIGERVANRAAEELPEVSRVPRTTVQPLPEYGVLRHSTD